MLEGSVSLGPPVLDALSAWFWPFGSSVIWNNFSCGPWLLNVWSAMCKYFGWFELKSCSFLFKIRIYLRLRPTEGENKQELGVLVAGFTPQKPETARSESGTAPVSSTWVPGWSPAPTPGRVPAGSCMDMEQSRDGMLATTTATFFVSFKTCSRYRLQDLQTCCENL